MGSLPLYHCQVIVFGVLVVRIIQGGRECHIHLGLQRGQRVTVPGSSTLVIAMVTSSVAVVVVSAVGCLDCNYIHMVGVASILKVGGTLEAQHPVHYGEVVMPSPPARDQTDRLALRIHCRKGRYGTRMPFSAYSSGASPSKSGISVHVGTDLDGHRNG